jgi:hypothetical protein
MESAANKIIKDVLFINAFMGLAFVGPTFFNCCTTEFSVQPLIQRWDGAEIYVLVVKKNENEKRGQSGSSVISTQNFHKPRLLGARLDCLHVSAID